VPSDFGHIPHNGTTSGSPTSTTARRWRSTNCTTPQRRQQPATNRRREADEERAPRLDDALIQGGSVAGPAVEHGPTRTVGHEQDWAPAFAGATATLVSREAEHLCRQCLPSGCRHSYRPCA